MTLPGKLSPDAIVEAILEIRFESPGVSELTVGALVDAWRDYSVIRLPMANLPSPIRAGDPNLKFHPTLQLSSSDGKEVVKIGENVISLHSLGGYPGWDGFRPSLKKLVEVVLGRVSDPTITRLGIRYVNLMHGKRHAVGSVADLNVNIHINESPLEPPLILNYRRSATEFHEVLTKVASPEFVVGPTEEFTALIDVDVYTPDGPTFDNAAKCMDWVDKGHEIVKAHFFELLRPDTIKMLEDR
ncbi:MAG: TIGR04255 family protein [Mesorhizobium sp.]|uniref:TIGR04255 family protein n=1 Tax=Mesorhizobium sp. TaxID=1871066 RepID=UPI000FE625ED|nr:TIGR04255 family protein [Mesorhizobium sp.]RWE25225.1 MAG: TIGR04255 family protein [Mesorhizobium sp.]